MWRPLLKPKLVVWPILVGGLGGALGVWILSAVGLLGDLIDVTRLDAVAKKIVNEAKHREPLLEAMATSDLFETSVPVGTIVAWPGPPGEENTGWHQQWRMCDGGTVPATKQSPIYRAIGTMYGTAGPEEVRLPDLRGMFLRGSGGSDSHVSAPLGSQQRDLVRKHMHKIGGRGVDVGSGSAVRLHVLHTPNGSHPIETDSRDYSDSNLGEETRPVNYAVHWAMRVK